MGGKNLPFDFTALVSSIRKADLELTAHASRAVNISLTVRNWLIGYYVREYEQNGTDRAKYGEQLLEKLSDELTRSGMKGSAARSLRLYRQFYLTYPQIRQTLSAKLLPDQLVDDISMFPPRESRAEQPIHVLKNDSEQSSVPIDRLLPSLSFSHFVELLGIDDPSKRTFYEIECVRGNWSLRELKRQIGSLYYERSGLSVNKEKLAAAVQSDAESVQPKLAIRDPYVFEFLGLKPREVMYESELEDALLDKLQEFLLELGHGFCFEARQKRVLIGDTYSFVDLVFYHRILKCHVLIELKVEEFTHGNVGQLNTYLNWYRKHVMTEGDNPPIGILLCTQKDQALVEYALAGMDNHLFVSKYQLELPGKEEMQRFLERQIRRMEHEN